METQNDVKARTAAGETVFGAYISVGAPAIVEMFAIAGLDFVRLDPYHGTYNRETLESMTRAAYAARVTPWARVRNDPYEIATTLDMGVQIVTVPNVASAEDARRAAQAARYPPFGERENGRPMRMRGMSEADYLSWAEREIWVSVQIEGLGGVEHFPEIVAVEGIHCVQTGRGDLSNALGLPGQRSHPKVLEIEDRIVDAALSAGKQVSLHADLSPAGLEYVQRCTGRGVRIFTLDVDYNVMIRTYRNFLTELRAELP